MANRTQAKLKFYDGYGENFKTLRENAGLTLSELGEQINYSDKTISMIETETRPPTIEQLNIYAEKFNVSLDYLTGRTKAMKPDIQMISDYTGLTPEVIDNLHELKNQTESYDVNESLYALETLNKVLLTAEFFEIIISLSALSHSTANVAALTPLDIEEISKKHNIDQSLLVKKYVRAIHTTFNQSDKFIDYLFTSKPSDCRYRNIKNIEKLNVLFDKTKSDDMSTDEILELFDKAAEYKRPQYILRFGRPKDK